MVRRLALFFLAGAMFGFFVAQGLCALASRTGGRYGGEVLMLPLFVLLIYIGIQLGRRYPGELVESGRTRTTVKGITEYLSSFKLDAGIAFVVVDPARRLRYKISRVMLLDESPAFLLETNEIESLDNPSIGAERWPG